MHLVAKGTLAAGSHSVPGSCRWMLHRLHDALSLKPQGSTREQQQVHGKCIDDREEQQRQQQWESHRHPHRHSQHTTRTTKGNRRVTAVLLVHAGAGLAGLGQRKTHLRTYEWQRKQSWLSQRGRMLWEERLLVRHLKRGFAEWTFHRLTDRSIGDKAARCEELLIVQRFANTCT